MVSYHIFWIVIMHLTVQTGSAEQDWWKSPRWDQNVYNMTVCSLDENMWDWVTIFSVGFEIVLFTLSVCQWISVLSIFGGPCRFLVSACWDYRATCLKAGNDCVYHCIGDNKFIVLIPNIITCHLPTTLFFFFRQHKLVSENKENWCSWCYSKV